VCELHRLTVSMQESVQDQDEEPLVSRPVYRHPVDEVVRGRLVRSARECSFRVCSVSAHDVAPFLRVVLPLPGEPPRKGHGRRPALPVASRSTPHDSRKRRSPRPPRKSLSEVGQDVKEKKRCPWARAHARPRGYERATRRGRVRIPVRNQARKQNTPEKHASRAWIRESRERQRTVRKEYGTASR